MSFVNVAPQLVSTAAADAARIGSAINTANTAAAATTQVLAAAQDEVSTAIAALFGSHGQHYQAISAQVAAYQQRFVLALSQAGSTYAVAEAASATPLQRFGARERTTERLLKHRVSKLIVRCEVRLVLVLLRAHTLGHKGPLDPGRTPERLTRRRVDRWPKNRARRQAASAVRAAVVALVGGHLILILNLGAKTCRHRVVRVHPSIHGSRPLAMNSQQPPPCAATSGSPASDAPAIAGPDSRHRRQRSGRRSLPQPRRAGPGMNLQTNL